VQKLPHKIDIGAVFSAAPRVHIKFKLFEPVHREFIIVFDLTDYDFLDVDVKKLETCDRCWPLMALACRVLTTALRQDFGFDQMLWVYSGRRGIHSWVCDTRARVMNNEVRSAVADYLGPKLNPATGRLSISIPMHPTLASAYTTELKPFFEKVILKSTEDGGFGMLDYEDSQRKLLDMLQDDMVRDRMLEEWGKRQESGLARWGRLDALVQKLDANPKREKRLAPVLVEIIFTYTYPRLDVNVSKGMNHLLKSPWCAHPKTGRVCVPLDPEAAADFDPSQVPTLRMVADELDAAHKAGAEMGKGRDISSTRLGKYEAAFEDFLRRSENTVRGERLRAGKETASLDF